MQRFKLTLQSCEGDSKRLRQCLASGYWRNAARWMADGTYRSVRGDMVGLDTFDAGVLNFLIFWIVQVLHVHPNSVLFTRKPRSGWVVFHEMEETKKTQ